MRETLFNANGQDETRIKRAFRWVITFRDFPVGSYQTVDGDSMMTEALTLFTKGRAEFYLDGVRRRDRVAGILSSEYEPVGMGGTFELRYVEPTTRVCIPKNANGGRLPSVRKHMYHQGRMFSVPAGFQGLVCLGSVSVNDKVFRVESTFKTLDQTTVTALEDIILLEFLT